ncbi:hypothetical protein AVEN_206496-1 [Araneus ventricosus]|uniref:DDE-1 domain-containing protein n=1 Tax=Araneus ventricosus TaxID=182803 RepID=A0A4Y2KKR2_ARAVE|nr:hypothetical protein AVEN_206496-1 [Araneus ventricosus]
MWRSNNKVWVTRDLFTVWIDEVFAPSVKDYLLQMNLPLHALLIMDNAPAHSPDIQDDLLEEFKFTKIQFLPPNTTPLFQPMDQQVPLSASQHHSVIPAYGPASSIYGHPAPH